MYETCHITTRMLAFCKCFMAFRVVSVCLSPQLELITCFLHTDLGLIPDLRPIALFLHTFL